MPIGILHRRATEKAVELLGDGAKTKGFRKELKRWVSQATDGVEDEHVVQTNIRPDAFRIHRDHPSCKQDEKYFLIDIIEIDGSSTLKQKIHRYSSFGEAVDESGYAFLRLRLFSEHFVLLGEYSEIDLCEISIEMSA